MSSSQEDGPGDKNSITAKPLSFDDNASAWERVVYLKDRTTKTLQNSAAITFWFALEWSALLPVWTFAEFVKDRKDSARIILFAVHVLAAAVCVATIADPEIDRDVGILAGSLLGGVWIIALAAGTDRKESDLLVQCARALSLVNFVILTPLWFESSPFSKIARMVIIVCHAIAGTIITIIALSARQLWDAWSCYTIRPVPQGFLDHGLGVCTAVPTDIDLIRTIGGAVTPEGTRFELWRKEIHVAAILEAVAAAFYIVAIFKRDNAPKPITAAIDRVIEIHDTARRTAGVA